MLDQKPLATDRDVGVPGNDLLYIYSEYTGQNV